MAVNLWLLCCIWLLYPVAAAKQQSDVRAFSVISSTSWGPQRLDNGWTERSLLTCIAGCFEGYSSRCHSVMYNSLTRLCTPGSWMNQEEAPPSSAEGNLYIDHWCDASQGFTLHTNGSASACILYSSNRMDYTEAQEFCASKQAHVLTVKSIEKLELVRQVITGNVYVGLTDSETEGKFVWDDDGQEIGSSLITTLFRPGEPNDHYGAEDCSVLYSFNGLMNDMPCSSEENFVCERPV